MFPQLILDEQFFSDILKFNCYCEDCCYDYDEDSDYSDGDYGILPQCQISEGKLARSELVNKMLLCHVGPIHKFTLDLPHWFPEYPDISHWVQFATSKNVKEFTLSQQPEGYSGFCQSWQLPSSMFSPVGFDNLTHLTLTDFSFPSLPATFRGFPCLISLVVRMLPSYLCRSEPNGLGILVSKCPQLESLDCTTCDSESCLTIRAPKLQNLVLSGNLSSICLEETKKIKTLFLDTELGLKQHKLKEFFSCLPHVEELVLGERFLVNWLSEAGPIEKLKPPIGLRQLKHLTLVQVELDSQIVFPFILCLFLMASKLQELKLCVGDTFEEEPFLGNMIVDKDFRLDHLRNVLCCLHFSDDGLALQLVKLILLSSPVLEVMTVQATIETEEKLHIDKMLLQCHRASANARIIFKPCDLQDLSLQCTKI